MPPAAMGKQGRSTSPVFPLDPLSPNPRDSRIGDLVCMAPGFRFR